jgi:hypothetical protein
VIARLRAALPALHHRDFALLFSGQAISVIGDALFPVEHQALARDAIADDAADERERGQRQCLRGQHEPEARRRARQLEHGEREPIASSTAPRAGR